MSVKSSQINATDLDFETIQAKTYQGQDKFKDYDFKGSICINWYGYRSCKWVEYKHHSELCPDSAQIRKNVVSRAKDLGFVHRNFH